MADISLSCDANVGNVQRRRSHVAFWAWEQREQITVISSRASRTEELTNPGTWGESKRVLPDREMSAAKKKVQQHRLLLFSCQPCQQNHSREAGEHAQPEEQKVGAFGLSSCTLINWRWDLKTSYQLHAKDTDESVCFYSVCNKLLTQANIIYLYVGRKYTLATKRCNILSKKRKIWAIRQKFEAWQHQSCKDELEMSLRVAEVSQCDANC